MSIHTKENCLNNLHQTKMNVQVNVVIVSI